MADTDINRLKIVLVEKKRMAKWLAGEISKDPATISKWRPNKAQPDIETFRKIAEAIDMDMKDLLCSTK